MASGFPAAIDDLGLTGALDLARATGQVKRLRLAPTRRMTLALIERLRQTGVMDVPSPAPRRDIAAYAHETLIEGLQWRAH